ncbi:MAG: hypothetical protein IID18_06190, partial [Nitrospinae bacterium]|nr:hypothetical protein [Nitrospinota bacterium]
GFNSQEKEVASGTYSYKVTAESSSGNVVLAQTFTSGLVTDVIFEEDENFAVVNGEKISISEITRVSINQ